MTGGYPPVPKEETCRIDVSAGFMFSPLAGLEKHHSMVPFNPAGHNLGGIPMYTDVYRIPHVHTQVHYIYLIYLIYLIFCP